MQTIAIVSQKGGAGKTTLAVNLAAEAARSCVSLIIDTDPPSAAPPAPPAAVIGASEPVTVADLSSRIVPLAPTDRALACRDGFSSELSASTDGRHGPMGAHNNRSQGYHLK